MVPPSDDSPKSLGDGATGSDVEPSEPSSPQSVGDQSTTGDMGSSVSDLDALVGDLDDDQGEVVDLAARYEIQETLGQGGMGEVVLARDKRLNRQVAIKRLKEELGANRKAAQRFLTEAQSVAALNHFNIVQIHDYGRAADGPFIVMEYVGGGSLAETLAGGALELERTIELGCQLCDAIGVAHQAGIIHRDIKPANVLMTAEGFPKLTDFGLARQETVDGGQTQAGAVLGTLDFMAPEQKVDATKTDARSDLWSVGATLYQMVTGEVPRVIDLDEVPETIRSVLAQALKTKPDARYQSAEEFREALRDVRPDSAPATSEGGLAEGECPSCSTTNDSSRKFCRNCAAPLEAPCLSCKTVMPMWEDVCGSCGSRQSELAAQRREELQSQQRQAELHCESFMYAEAVVVAQALLEEPNPRLQPLDDWVKRFIEKVEREGRQQWERVQELFTEAETHEQAYDYTAGIRTLKQVEEPLRDKPVKLSDGSTGNVNRLLTRLQDAHETSESLDRKIRKRLKQRELNGLLPDVNALVRLRPGRPGLLKLQVQLQERDSRQQDRLLSQSKSRVSELIKELRFQDAMSLLSKLEKSGQVGWKELRMWVQSTRAKVDLEYKSLRLQWDELERSAKRAYEQENFGRVVKLITAIPEHQRGNEATKIRHSAQRMKQRQRDAREDFKRKLIVAGFAFIIVLMLIGLLIWNASRSAGYKKSTAGTSSEQRSIAKNSVAKNSVEVQNPLTLKGHAQFVTSASFSPDGKRIVSGSADKTVEVWDAQTGQETFTLKGHSDWVRSVSFSPDGQRIVSGSFDKTVKIWDISSLATSN